MARGGFPGIPGGNMQQLMRQAQKMQQQMMKAQEELDARGMKARAGGGAVSCKVSGAPASLPDHRQGRGRSRRGRNAPGI